MNILLILLMVSMVVVFMQRHKAPKLATMALGVLVALSFVFIGVRFFASASRSAAAAAAAFETFEQASAYRLGQALAEDIPAESSILVLHGGFYREAGQDRLNKLVSALEDGLDAPYILNVEGPDMSQIDYEEDDLELFDLDMMNETSFVEYLSRHPDTDAVVSFIGTPYFHRFPEPESVPPLYVMGGMEFEHDREALEQGLLEACVVFRTDVDWNARPRRGMKYEEVFNLRYKLLRPDR